MRRRFAIRNRGGVDQVARIVIPRDGIAVLRAVKLRRVGCVAGHCLNRGRPAAERIRVLGCVGLACVSMRRRFAIRNRGGVDDRAIVIFPGDCVGVRCPQGVKHGIRAQHYVLPIVIGLRASRRSRPAAEALALGGGERVGGESGLNILRHDLGGRRRFCAVVGVEGHGDSGLDGPGAIAVVECSVAGFNETADITAIGTGSDMENSSVGVAGNRAFDSHIRAVDRQRTDVGNAIRILGPEPDHGGSGEGKFCGTAVDVEQGYGFSVPLLIVRRILCERVHTERHIAHVDRHILDGQIAVKLRHHLHPVCITRDLEGSVLQFNHGTGAQVHCLGFGSRGTDSRVLHCVCVPAKVDDDVFRMAVRFDRTGGQAGAFRHIAQQCDGHGFRVVVRHRVDGIHQRSVVCSANARDRLGPMRREGDVLGDGGSEVERFVAVVPAEEHITAPGRIIRFVQLGTFLHINNDSLLTVDKADLVSLDRAVIEGSVIICRLLHNVARGCGENRGLLIRNDRLTGRDHIFEAVQINAVITEVQIIHIAATQSCTRRNVLDECNIFDKADMFRVAQPSAGERRVDAGSGSGMFLIVSAHPPVINFGSLENRFQNIDCSVVRFILIVADFEVRSFSGVDAALHRCLECPVQRYNVFLAVVDQESAIFAADDSIRAGNADLVVQGFRVEQKYILLVASRL